MGKPTPHLMHSLLPDRALVHLESRVLVVDQNPTSQRLTAGTLRQAGLTVDCTSSHLHACRLIMERSYGVVVLDVAALAKGDESVVGLASEADLPAMFVVTCSPNDNPSTHLAGRSDESNLAGVLRTPFHGDDLLEVVQRAAAVAARRAHVRGGVNPDLFTGQVLLLDDDLEAAREMQQQLIRIGIHRERITHVTHLEAALKPPSDSGFELAIIDLHLRDAVGLDAVRALGATYPDLPLVVLARQSLDLAEEALFLGAQEVLEGDSSDDAVMRILRRARMRKQSDKKMRYRGSHDAMTGLFNAARFREQLSQCITRVRRDNTACAVLYLDLDGFKPVNDLYGHAAGDQVLRVVAGRLEDAIRTGDCAARLGGDEFAVLLEDVYDQKTVRQVAQRILRAICAPIHIEQGSDVRVTASIGIAMCPQVDQHADPLIEAADSAMLAAKQAGRSQYCFAENHNTSTAAQPRARLLSEVREAAELGQFYLVYQPQLDLRSRRVTGLEALLRWQRPDGAKVGPDEFIPLLEQLDLIGAVGTFVLKEACRHMRSLGQRGTTHVRVAVNVAAAQLEDPGFCDSVLRILAEHDLPTTCLELEVTEGTLMRQGSVVRGNLRKLRESGVRIALDDFGTGYAALSYLREFPLDAIKIDRSFVAPLETDQRARILVGAIIDLGRQLGMEVLAEGVETAHQLAYLRERGCDSCQGFLFGKPHFTGHLADLLH